MLLVGRLLGRVFRGRGVYSKFEMLTVTGNESNWGVMERVEGICKGGERNFVMKEMELAEREIGLWECHSRERDGIERRYLTPAPTAR